MVSATAIRRPAAAAATASSPFLLRLPRRRRPVLLIPAATEVSLRHTPGRYLFLGHGTATTGAMWLRLLGERTGKYHHVRPDRVRAVHTDRRITPDRCWWLSAAPRPRTHLSR